MNSLPSNTSLVKTAPSAVVSSASSALATSAALAQSTPSARCLYRSACGRQCRSLSDAAHGRFCAAHAAKDARADAADLSAALKIGRSPFRSARDVNRSLGELFKLLARDQISPRRAAVLAYVASLGLRSLYAMDQQADRASANEPPPQVIWNFPSAAPHVDQSA